MIFAIKKQIKKHFSLGISRLFGIDFTPESVSVEFPQTREMGDISVTSAFDLAKILRKAPRIIACEIAEGIPLPDFCEKMEVAGAGYINLYFDRKEIFRSILTEKPLYVAGSSKGKIIVEHTNINPNKAAHIGHIRNAVIGDTLVRLLKYQGFEVEVQNFIDDTGVQVADIVAGFVHLEKRCLKEIQEIREPLDKYCWKLYSKVSDFFAEDEERKNLRGQILRKLEKGEGEEGAVGRYISSEITRCHLRTMRRLGVTYDLLPKESDILALDFWTCAFEKLKGSDFLYRAQDEKKKGCWVMKLSESQLFKDMEDADKILIRSNGTVTYTAKDIAYQMWKLGILGKDFNYTRFIKYEDGAEVWTTSPEGETGKCFGNADKVYNVIDVRQAYLQNIVNESLRMLGFQKEADSSVHFSYEMVAMSPASCIEMGIKLSEDESRKDFIEMSGRRGIGVQADDLIDSLVSKAVKEVGKRNPDFSEQEVWDAGTAIASAALRYFMVKFTKNKLITFDFDEVLSFEGETGPYLQYSVVRAENIIRKLNEEKGIAAENVQKLIDDADLGTLSQNSQWEIIYRILMFEDSVFGSISSLELSYIAHYAYNLAKEFNSFYHNNPVMNEKNSKIQATRVLIVIGFIGTMRKTLNLLGIDVPRRM